jgi:UrcA family protein
MNTPDKFRPITRLERIAKILITGGAMALAVHSPSAAIAAESVRQVTVRYDDLNLTSASGIKVLKQRIWHAAEIVCGEVDTRELDAFKQYLKCARDATDSALARVNWRGN